VHLAIYHPAIPQNTGNLGRLCVGLATELHLIGPCAFDFSEKALRRAGLDYWQHLHWTLHADAEAFLAWLGGRRPWPVTKHGAVRYDRAAFSDDDVVLIGNENTGLPDAWLARWADRCVSIPMLGPLRSFNQCNAAAIVLAQATLAAGRFDRLPHHEA